MEELEEAADAIAQATALLITAGAGMGVDSGLPDFRGNAGFWKAYPPYKRLGMSFVDMAEPSLFKTNRNLAWGFYGHRRNLYRETQPHEGFAILKEWAEKKRDGYFVVTSNVDNAFQKAGFDDERIAEIHGSIEFNQCCSEITPAGPESVEVDMESMKATAPLPKCPKCGKVTRPNIMMFGDPYWNGNRTHRQLNRFYEWIKKLKTVEAKLVVVECGAGIMIPSIRQISEEIGVDECGGRLVRINPNHPDCHHTQIELEMGALKALKGIKEATENTGPIV